MRLPDLAGFHLEKPLGEDPFGWNYLAGNQGDEKRLVRFLKSQATQDHVIAGSYEKVIALTNPKVIAQVDRFSPRMVGMPATVSYHFPGWKGQSGEWHLSTIFQLARMMEKDEVIDVSGKIIQSLGQLHRQGVVHGGIQPGNLFLTGQGTEPEIKLVGLGEMVAPGLQQVEAWDYPFYLAPEQFLSSTPTQETVAQWDVYSSGVILFLLLCKHFPRLDLLYQQYRKQPERFQNLTLVSMGHLTKNAAQIHQLLGKERHLEWPDEPAGEAESAVRSIVEKCLSFDPSHRYTNMAEVSNAFLNAQQELEKKIREQYVEAQAAAAVPAATAPQTSPGTPPQPASSRAAQPAAHASAPESAGAKPATPETQLVGVSAEKETAPATAQREYGTLDDIFEDAPDSRPSKPKKSRHIFTKLPVIRQVHCGTWLDKCFAVLAVLTFLAVVGFAGFYRFQYSWTERKKIHAVNSLKANIARQAQSYMAKIAENEKSAQDLQDDLEQVEDTKARLEGEAALAKQLLRQSQDSGDQFFRLVLENDDTDVPEFREGRRKALIDGKQHYELLIDIYGDDPYFLVSKAHAYYYLGRIQSELGDFAEAEASFTEAEYRYAALLERKSSAVFVENLAVSKQSLAKLAFRNGRFPVASQLYYDSSQYWQRLKGMNPSQDLDIAVEINSNSIQVVECHFALNDIPTALQGATEITDQFLKLQKGFPENEKVVGGLARSFELLGKIYEREGEGDKAIETYQQASTLFGDAIKKNSSVDLYHLGLGNSLARAGLLKNDFEKLQSSADVLAQVISRNPHEPVYLSTLADVYGVLAENQRDGGKLSNAIRLEEEAVALLGPIVKNNRGVPLDIHFSYSKRLVHLAELRVDNNKFEESRAPLKEAIQVLSVIAEAENARPVYRRSLATARGLAGFACFKSGDKSSAKTFYELAKADWKTYIEQNPNDEDAANNARWASDQLKALR